MEPRYFTAISFFDACMASRRQPFTSPSFCQSRAVPSFDITCALSRSYYIAMLAIYAWFCHMIWLVGRLLGKRFVIFLILRIIQIRVHMRLALISSTSCFFIFHALSRFSAIYHYSICRGAPRFSAMLACSWAFRLPSIAFIFRGAFLISPRMKSFIDAYFLFSVIRRQNLISAMTAAAAAAGQHTVISFLSGHLMLMPRLSLIHYAHWCDDTPDDWAKLYYISIDMYAPFKLGRSRCFIGFSSAECYLICIQYFR